jgi:hypothetical protein
VNEVGLFDHVPSFAVSVDPCFAVPLIVGGEVFCGAAAERAVAAAAKAPTAASASATMRASFGLIFMLVPLFRVS